MREERIALENHADAASMHRNGVDPLAIEGDGARIGIDEAGDHP
jgi:hypothetical protein